MRLGFPQGQFGELERAVSGPARPSVRARAPGRLRFPARVRRIWAMLLCVFLALGSLSSGALHAEDRPALTHSHNPADVRKLPAGYSELTSAHLAFQVPEGLVGRAQALLPQAERMREELLDALLPLPTSGASVPELPERRWVIRLAEDDAAFLALQPGKPPPWAAGVAWPSYGLIVLRTDRPDPFQQQPLEMVLRHELVHLLLSDLFGLREVPRWFDEGVARLLAREASVDQWVRLSQAVVMDALIPFRSLETQFPVSAGEAEIAYAQSREFLRWLIERFGPELLPGLVQELRTGQTLNEALWRQTRYGLKALERQWQDHLESSFAWVSALGGGMTLLWGLGSVLLVLGWRRRKQQSAERHARWDAEEAQELALREAWERMERAARLQRVQRQLVEGAPLAIYNGQMLQPRDISKEIQQQLRQKGQQPGRSGQDDASRGPSSEPEESERESDETDPSPRSNIFLDDEDDYAEDQAEDEADTDAEAPEAVSEAALEDEAEDPDDRPPPGGWLH